MPQHKPYRNPLLLALSAVALLCALGLAVLWQHTPDPLERVLRWPVSPVLLDNKGELIHARLSANQEWCLPVPLAEMGHWLPKILVAVEDKRFYSHPGVDFLALARALVQNAKAGRVVSGASTITSQLVRISTPRGRTVENKALEFIGALKLERTLSKEEILEYYLNRAPFGGPIRGVEAAARIYFGKRAKELSLGEASLLVGLLKGPTAYRPDRNPKAALQRRQQIIRNAARQNGIDGDIAALALQEPLPSFAPAMPAQAWHFADLVFATLPGHGGVARSTLDRHAQELLERTLNERLPQFGDRLTAAGVVVDNKSGGIIAYVGNARFDPGKGKNWVDCAIAPRSPGSTLKPFIYLLAMEKGSIIPASLLADTPLQLGGEAPRNFDLHYRGPVSAYRALADSLNVPAVRVMRMAGVKQTLKKLRTAGFAHLNRQDSEYGDSLVLGAGEVSVLELARAYAALANLGLDIPLLVRASPEPGAGQAPDTGANPAGSGTADTLPQKKPLPPGSLAIPLERYGSSRERADAPMPLAPALPSGLAPLRDQLAAAFGKRPAPRRIHSAAASFLVADILKDTGRLPFLYQLLQSKEGAPVAFKTGTSFGLRDAWTAAYTPRHTVVIWFGQADGGADRRLVGVSLATPAAISIVRKLAQTPPVRGAAPPKDDTFPELDKGWYMPPEGVGSVPVCTLSGAAPGAFCPSTKTARNITDAWRTVPCPVHLLKDGKITLLWPPELEDFTRKRFAREDLGREAFIASPMPGTRYIITPGARRSPIPLKAEGVAYPVHWYADGNYIGEQEEQTLPLYWQPSGGSHTISLLDARERIVAVRVEVTDLGLERDAPLLGAE